MNCKMSQLKRGLETAGFANVRTLLSSGNVAFDSRSRSEGAVERKVEKAIEHSMGRAFRTIVRSTAYLQALVASDPFSRHRLPANAKCVVTFLRKTPERKGQLPRSTEDAPLLRVSRREVLSAYLPSPKAPVFLRLIEKTFGTDVTTRTWNTVRKCAKA